jgi:hypothetical protein
MTAEGYDYEYALTTSIHDQWGYGSYSSTTGTFPIEVTVDPPPWTCGSCRDMRFMSGHARHVGTCASCRKTKGQVNEHTPGPRHERPRGG